MVNYVKYNLLNFENGISFFFGKLNNGGKSTKKQLNESWSTILAGANVQSLYFWDMYLRNIKTNNFVDDTKVHTLTIVGHCVLCFSIIYVRYVNVDSLTFSAGWLRKFKCYNHETCNLHTYVPNQQTFQQTEGLTNSVHNLNFEILKFAS